MGVPPAEPLLSLYLNGEIRRYRPRVAPPLILFVALVGLLVLLIVLGMRQQ